MISRRKKTRPVTVGSRIIGDLQRIPVQTMWKAPLGGNLSALADSLERLAGIGCDILRFAVPGREEAEGLVKLSTLTEMPLVADIHFDYQLALICIESGIAKIRINPGNLGAKWKSKEVVRRAGARGKAIRVGINSGSLPRKLRNEGDMAGAMVKAAEDELEILASEGFEQAVFSLKSPDIETMVRANSMFSRRHDCPLHIGVTEAGPLIQGVVKNSIGISRLLQQGIGDTVRVSLSDSPENEIIAGKAILSAENIGKESVTVVSCPTCGRKSFPVEDFVREIMPELNRIEKRLTVAVMGCEVNGPEEARHADIGITGAGNKVIIFRRGEIRSRTDAVSAKKIFLEELNSL